MIAWESDRVREGLGLEAYGVMFLVCGPSLTRDLIHVFVSTVWVSGEWKVQHMRIVDAACQVCR
jgi:hypothetical protein